MENKKLDKSLNTLPQLIELGNKVTEELDVVSVDFLGNFNEIISSGATKNEKLDDIKGLSNRLVKVRTQSELTHQFKEARKSVKGVSDLLRTSESTYIEGIRAIEAQINEPLTKEKERVEAINSYMADLTTYLEEVNKEVISKEDITVLWLERTKQEVVDRWVLPEREEEDNVAFSPYMENLYNNLVMLVDNNIRMYERIESLQKEVASKEETKEPEKTVKGIFDNILGYSLEEKSEANEEKFVQEYVLETKLNDSFTEYAKKLLSGANPEIQELLADTYIKFQSNQIIGGAIDIDVALSILITEMNQWITKRR